MHRFLNVGSDLAGVDTLNSSVKFEMLLNCKFIPEDIKLGAEANLQLDNLQLRFYAESTDPGVTACGLVQASELADKGCFAGSVGAEEAEELAIINFQIDIFVCYFRLAFSKCWVNFSDVFCYKWVVRIIQPIQRIYKLPLIPCILIFQL